MPRVVQQVKFQPITPKPKRVAAYARVSSGKDAMLHSLSAQVDYYSTYIRHHAGWEYVGVYADEAKTGTKDCRENFQQMLIRCRSGEIDHIITKSISRFARNTITLLETVRELKDLGVSVYFEEQNIDTLSVDGELMLSILASYAQEESLSASENQKWRIKRNFEEGKPWRGFMLGYRYDNGKYIVVPKEAKIVKTIFSEYLSGKGVIAIMRKLNEEGILTQQGYTWHKSAVTRILRNYTYTGNLLLQTKFRENHLTKRTLVNKGQLPQYHTSNSHEPIIDLATFNEVQAEITRRADKYAKPQPKKKYPFSGLITCAICGKHYRRKVTATGPIWICSTYNTLGKSVCPSKAIPESALLSIADEVSNVSSITKISADKNNILIVSLADGSKITKQWRHSPQGVSRTDKMRCAITKRKEPKLCQQLKMSP